MDERCLSLSLSLLVSVERVCGNNSSSNSKTSALVRRTKPVGWLISNSVEPSDNQCAVVPCTEENKTPIIQFTCDFLFLFPLKILAFRQLSFPTRFIRSISFSRISLWLPSLSSMLFFRYRWPRDKPSKVFYMWIRYCLDHTPRYYAVISVNKFFYWCYLEGIGSNIFLLIWFSYSVRLIRFSWHFIYVWGWLTGRFSVNCCRVIWNRFLVTKTYDYSVSSRFVNCKI